MQQRRRTNVVSFAAGSQRSTGPWWLAAIVLAGVGFAGGYALAAPEQATAFVRATVGPLGLAGCQIKGNVSINSGARIYHVPGQRHYDETIIRLEYGERWFCSEQEARAAGWRRSGV
jgi:hypothetical protein